MSEPSFRPACDGDVPAITRIIADAYAPYLKSLPGLPDVAGGLDEELQRRKSLLAEQDGRILGVIIYDLGTDGATVFNMAVAPDAQGGGLGARLLSKVEEAAAAAGLGVVTLRTHRMMARTLRFYERLGWAPVARDGDVVTMRKRL